MRPRFTCDLGRLIDHLRVAVRRAALPTPVRNVSERGASREEQQNE